MTASRDIQSGKATGLQRPPLSSSIAQSLPARNSYNGKPLHSASLSNINPAHRINRRKSSFSIGSVNVAALAAAAKEGSMDIPMQTRTRGSTQADRLGKSPNIGSMLSPGFLPSSLKHASTVPETMQDVQSSSAVEDEPSLDSMTDKGNNKSRVRRASEGARMIRTKSNSAGQVRCETCGKGYKHGSCLTKHLWEHTPEWQFTSKLLISKHQQVQLLEAASVLLAMNSDAPVQNPLALTDSDLSSASPAASGSSEPADPSDMSSRTSTPSELDDEEEEDNVKPLSRSVTGNSYADHFSHSYRSTGVGSIPGSSSQDVSYLRRWSTAGRRPSNASIAFSGSPYEQSDLAAAAAGLLSCSIGTPKSGPTHLHGDVPPVPPLPAKYREHNKSRPVSYGAFSAKNEDAPKTDMGRFHQHDYNHQDVEMDDDSNTRGRSEEEDDGIFGTMDQ